MPPSSPSPAQSGPKVTPKVPQHQYKLFHHLLEATM